LYFVVLLILFACLYVISVSLLLYLWCE